MLTMVEIPNKQLFLPREAAEILAVSVQTVYRWIEDGTLATHLTIKPYRITRASLLKILSPDSQV